MCTPRPHLAARRSTLRWASARMPTRISETAMAPVDRSVVSGRARAPRSARARQRRHHDLHGAGGEVGAREPGPLAREHDLEVVRGHDDGGAAAVDVAE